MDYFDKTINIGDEIFCEEDGSWGDVINTHENGNLEVHFESGVYADQTWIVPEKTLSDRYDYYVMSMKNPGVFRMFKNGIDYKIKRYDSSVREGHSIIFWNIFTKFLESSNWPYNVLKKNEILEIERDTHNKLKNCKAYYGFNDDGYTGFVKSGIYVEDESYYELSKFLIKVNSINETGHFEITEDGEIIATHRFDSYYPNLSITQLWNSVVELPGMFELFGDNILTLSLGYSNAEEEFEKAKIRVKELEEFMETD